MEVQRARVILMMDSAGILPWFDILEGPHLLVETEILQKPRCRPFPKTSSGAVGRSMTGFFDQFRGRNRACTSFLRAFLQGKGIRRQCLQQGSWSIQGLGVSKDNGRTPFLEGTNVGNCYMVQQECRQSKVPG